MGREDVLLVLAGAAVIGLVGALLFVPVAMRIATALGAIDHPKRGKIHQRPVPLMGGLGIWFAVLPTVAIAHWIAPNYFEPAWASGMFPMIAVALVLQLVAGMTDDLRDLSAKQKVLFQLPVALAVPIVFGPLQAIGIPEFGHIYLHDWGYVLSFLWIIGIANAINLIDGLDGLAGGVCAIIASSLAVMAATVGLVGLALLLGAIAGACVGFLVYNTSPARVFLGDTGSLSLGMILAISALWVGEPPLNAIPPGWKMPFIHGPLLASCFLFAYPVADTLLAMARRGIHGKSMFTADTGHVHHALMAYGLGHRNAARLIYIACLLVACASLALFVGNQLLLLISLMLVSSGATIGLHLVGFFRPFLPRSIRERRPIFQLSHHTAGFYRARMRLSSSRREILMHLEDGAAMLGLKQGRLVHRTPAEPSSQNGAAPPPDEIDTLHSWWPPNLPDSPSAWQEEAPASPLGGEENFTSDYGNWSLHGVFQPDVAGSDILGDHRDRILQMFHTAVHHLRRLSSTPSQSGRQPAMQHESGEFLAMGR